MAVAIGSVFANLALETAGFDRDVDKAVRKLKSGEVRMNRTMAALEKRFRRVGKSLSKAFSRRNLLIGAGLATGFALLAKRAIDAADSIAKTADKIGISTSALQEFRFAAQLSGLAVQQLDSGFEAFGKRIGELQLTGKGTLAEFLKQFDTDLQGALATAKNSDAALDIMFRAMAKLEKQTDRSALAAAAFGRQAGVAMTILVRDGTKGLEDMRQEARKLGVVLGEDVLRDAERASDELTKLGAVVSKRTTAAFLNMLPIIESTATLFINLTTSVGELIQRFTSLDRVTSIPVLTDQLVELRAESDKLFNTLNRRQRSINDLIAGGTTGGTVFDAATDIVDRTRAQFLALEDQIKATLARLDELRNPPPPPPTLKLPQIDVTGDAFAQVALRDGGTASLAPPDFSLQAEGVDRLTLSTIRLREETARLTTAKQTEMLVQTQVNDVSERGREIFDATRTATERHNIEIEELNGLLDAGAVTQDTFNRAVEQAADRFERASDATDEMGQAMQQAGDIINRQLEGIVFRTESAIDSVKRLGLEFAKLALQNIGKKLLGALLGGLGGGIGGGGSQTFTASTGEVAPLGFAHGGVIRPGKIGVVGERGPELAVGGSAGLSIFPNGFQLPDVGGGGGGGGVTINQSFDFRGAGPGAEVRLRQVAGEIVQAAVQQVRALTLQGGGFAKDMGKR